MTLFYGNFLLKVFFIMMSPVTNNHEILPTFSLILTPKWQINA